MELDSLAPKPLGSFSSVLSSRIPGVLVEQPSGAAGAGARIHIRGINSLVLPGDPLVLIDGVRVANSTTISTADVGGLVPSRLDAIDPEEIDRIEVLPGPAAGAMYGGDAADGVILITTRQGQSGRPVWRLHTQYGLLNDVTDYPANFGRVGTNPTPGNFAVRCSLDQENQDLCVPGPLTSWNPLENVSPFHTGIEQRHGLSVSGGGRTITYYVAGDYDRTDGVYADNRARHTRMSANITGHFARTLDLTLMSGYTDGMVRLPMGGDQYSGYIGVSLYQSVMADGLFGWAADDPISRGYADSLPTVLTRQVGAPQQMHETTVGANLRWQPSTWLRVTNTVGFDRVHLSTNDQRVSPNVFPGQSGDSVFYQYPDAYRSSLLSVRSDWQASYGHSASVSGSSAIGVQYNRQRVHNRQEEAIGIFSGGIAVPPYVVSTETLDPDASTVGLYVQQRFAWRSRLVLTGALRRDRTFSPARPATVIDGSASLSWLVSSEPFFPHASWLDGLRLRAAYGNTSRFLTSTMSALRPVHGPVLRRTPDLFDMSAPERTEETEAGFEAALFRGRLDASLSYYDRRSTHLAALMNPSVTIGAGAFGPYIGQDAAAIRTRGYEMLLGITPVSSRDMSMGLTVAGATDRNTLDTYGSDALLFLRSAQREVPGFATAGYWGRQFTYADANGDGIITRSEVQLDDTASFLGSAIPTRELSITPTLTFASRITLSALFDYRGGFKQHDQNEAYRCGNASIATCRAAEDPTAPLADQAAAVVRDIEADRGVSEDAGYIRDATFWKLREVAMSFIAPRQWAEHLGASDVRLTLAGRNLATWTRYPGLDPEINATPNDPLVRSDFATQPPVRDFTARVDVTW